MAKTLSEYHDSPVGNRRKRWVLVSISHFVWNYIPQSTVAFEPRKPSADTFGMLVVGLGYAVTRSRGVAKSFRGEDTSSLSLW